MKDTANPDEEEPASGIKVAVRMRPFNSREKKRNCKLVVEMDKDGSVTLDMTAQGKGTKRFNFDFAFWSFDNSRERATQDTIYNDLGFFVPEALKGFNCSIFAYGQTGSGKSYSMMGPVDNPGIIYRGLQDFFKQKASAIPRTKIELEVSFLEIYNEEVGDLLTKDNSKKLRVRVSSKKGVYIQGLTIKAVGDFDQAKWLIDMGFNNRSVASTNMNATSSRSHCIFTMYVTKVVFNEDGKKSSATEAKVSLIDLAGSERQSKTGASGARLREANAINQSLSALGNVISALSKGEKFVPYRSSVLTLLLRESLGGNAKTIMVCAISPADDNVMETWGTLRYAARTKEIVNKVKKNESEDPAIVITKLRENIKKLKAQLGRKTTNTVMNDELNHLEAEITRKSRSHEDRCQQLQQDVEEQNEELVALGLTGLLQVKADKNTPRLINISPDPMMSGKLIYFLSLDVDIVIGTKKRENPDENRIVLICSKSSNIKEEHALIFLSSETVTLTPKYPEISGLFVNGVRISQQTNIFHNDRIVFGNGQVCFHFISPSHQSPKPNTALVIDYEAITIEMHEKDEEVIKLQEQLKADRENQLEKEQVLKSTHKKMEFELKQMIKEESEMRIKLEEQIKALKDSTSEPSAEASIESLKEKDNLVKKLERQERGRKSLERTMTTHTQLISSCKQFDAEIEEQVQTAVNLCRLSDAMARLNNSSSHYYTFTLPFWNNKVGLLSEKVMILETYIIDYCSIDTIYDLESFQVRHEAHADYEFRDKTKIFKNPFVPDLSTRNIGFVNIKDTNSAMEPQEFSILPIGESTGCKGRVIA